jgi:DNA modification methylase
MEYMLPFYQDNHIKFYNKDCRSMEELADNSIQCVVTSPPYWGLRKYAGNQDLIWGGDKECKHEWIGREILLDNGRGDAQKSGKYSSQESIPDTLHSDNTCSLCGAWRGAFGLEPTPELYVQHTVEILREIKRVLRKDGVCFLNLGDSYYASGGAHKPEHANPGLSKSARRGGVPHVWKNGRRDKELLDLKVRDFFSQNPCGECVKILLNHSLDNYDYHALALAISDVLSTHSHKEQRTARLDNSDSAYQDGHNVDGTLGLCSFASFLNGVALGVQGSTSHAVSGEFPHCHSVQSYWDFPSLNEIVLPSLHQSNDGICPFWLYLFSHGIQGLTESILNTLEIDGSSVVRIKDMVYDSSAYSIIPHHHSNLKPKDLCLIPFRVAIAAQEDGWWVRSVIIWSKNNPMPESVKDRPTESHEYILMLTKSAHYYWDMEAVREKYTEPLNRWGGPEFRDSSHKYIELGGHDGQQHYGATSMFRKGRPVRPIETGRNLRSVWSFPTQPYREAHFAVFPEALPERCIKAGSKEGDIILDPFAGSGTTLWVAKKLNRKSVSYELSEEYCQLIIKRVRQQVGL